MLETRLSPPAGVLASSRAMHAASAASLATGPIRASIISGVSA